MAEKQINDMFGWLNEITLHKTHPKEISQESWKSFNSFMINKYVSMSPDYIELVNYVQRIPYEINNRYIQFIER